VWREVWSEEWDDAAAGWVVYPPGSASMRPVDYAAGSGVALDLVAGQATTRLLPPGARRLAVKPGDRLRIAGRSWGMAGTLGRLGFDYSSSTGAYVSGATSNSLYPTDGTDGPGTYEPGPVPSGVAWASPRVTLEPVGGPAAGTLSRGFGPLVVERWEAETIVGGLGANLLANGGFRARDGLFRMPNRWAYTNQGNATITKARVAGSSEPDVIYHDGDVMSADEALGGSTLIIEGTAAVAAAWPAFTQTVPALEGHTYSLRAMTAGMVGSVPNVIATLKDGKHAELSKVYLTGSAITDAHPGGPDAELWRDGSVSFVTPPGTRFVEVRCYMSLQAGSGAFRGLFDRVGLYEGPARSWEPEEELASLPYPQVLIGPGTTAYPTLHYESLTRSATWTLGRSWWFAPPEPGTATVELDGDHDELKPGDVLGIATGFGGGWTGRVDDVTHERAVVGGEVRDTTRVSAVEVTSWLASTKLAGWAVVAQTFGERVAALYQKAGTIIGAPVVMPAASTIASPAAGTVGTATDPVLASAYLEELERQHNAIVQVRGNGTTVVLKRDALPADLAGVPPPILLTGDDCPVSLRFDRSTVGTVVNLWRFTDGEEAYTTPVPSTGLTSAQSYGVREYDTRTPKANASRYPAGMRTALAEAQPTYVAELSIRRNGQPGASLSPFDLVELEDGTSLQVLALSTSVRPDAWSVSLVLDPGQGAISGTPTPPTPPPPTRKRATVSPSIAGDAYVVRTTGGLNAGNGAGGVILVGLLGDGNLSRGLVEWAGMTFAGRNRRVVSATLTLTTRRDGCMQYGSSPKVRVLRVTGSWSEGSYNAAGGCGFATSNAVKYPGPATTSSGAVSASVPASDGRSVAIRIDAIAQAWLDGAAQHGLELQGHTESSSAYRCGFSATGSTRARLSITYEYDE
jgi:hypothetical protein